MTTKTVISPFKFLIATDSTAGASAPSANSYHKDKEAVARQASAIVKAQPGQRVLVYELKEYAEAPVPAIEFKSVE